MNTFEPSKSQKLTIATWNLEWAAPRSDRGRTMTALLEAVNADVICLTEAFTGNLPNYGDVIEAEADYGYPIKKGRRKVILWTRHKWTDIDQIGHPDLPRGRFAAGTLVSPFGKVRVIGVCIPWAAAHVSTGRRDRVRWEDHTRFLEVIGRHIGQRTSDPTLILGDFNQTIPRLRQPIAVFDKLEEDLLSVGFNAVTAGVETSEGGLLIDHILHSPEVEGKFQSLLPQTLGGKRLTDHTGVVCQIF